ncbi:MAG: orotidine-5'-phosphate decarboxylase [Alphaproteobacteria bacterium]|nr:orotidine-5'-phosphate decarboxylase [Alphaproteobacteria bacterium]
MASNPVIYCSIDTADLDRACDLASKIAPVTGGIKLGLEFFNKFGPQGIEAVLKAAPDAQLFIDLKYHDIPNTVAGAVRSMCSNFEPAYLNVHASGGREMMIAAKESCSKGTKLLAVTILTSLDARAIEEVCFGSVLSESVKKLALLTQDVGLDGVVCSGHEIETLRNLCGDDFVLMVPGIRPAGTEAGDQKRVMSPQDALDAGATHLVIGRPITQADDPAKAAQDILDDLLS